MKALSKTFERVLLAAVLCTAFAGSARAVAETDAGQSAEVVTVADSRTDKANGTLWGLAMRYMPEETRSKKPGEYSGGELREIRKKILALQMYHNAVAQESSSGRQVVDVNKLKTGEKLYLPPQGVVEQIIGLMPQSGAPVVADANYDAVMRTVLLDVAENKESFAAASPTGEVDPTLLAKAEAAKQGDENLNGDGTRSLVGETVEDQDLEDGPPPADDSFLGEDGEPVKGEGSTSEGASGSTTGEGSAGEGSEGSGSEFASYRDDALQGLLGFYERHAAKPGPFQDQARRNAEEIRRILEERQKQKDQEAAEGSTPPSEGTTQVAEGSTPPGEGTTQVAGAGDAETGSAGEPSTGGSSSEEDYGEYTGGTEYVPDWYLRALQEWNLQAYWQSDKDSNSKTADSRGSRKIYDPLTGEEVDLDSYENPFEGFETELSNTAAEQGQMQKLEE